MDMVQFLLERLPPNTLSADALTGAAKPAAGTEVLYHPSCHAEWVGVHKGKAANIYAQAVAAFTGAKVRVNPGCCGESGMGAMTSPAIYNKLRARKRMRLEADFMTYADGAPVIVGCPSCKVGIKRTMLALKDKRPVLHTLRRPRQGRGGRAGGGRFDAVGRRAAGPSPPRDLPRRARSRSIRPAMKYLGIDYGTKRTGIAASDTGGSMAFPRRTIVMTTRDRFFAELLAVAE